jgi:PTH1 family peptidyl-tRNA hydrolase
MIVGLGNPGREYAATRHNLGFMVVDLVARRLGAGETRNRFRAELREAFDDGQKLVLLKPQTYMNLSGTSVREAVRWYKTPLTDVLVVADDIDLPFGTLRMRSRGGSGGHNGIKSILTDLGADTVPRLRIGIDRGSGQASRQVLTRFSPDEERALPDLVASAADCALLWARFDIIEAMNRCNRRPAQETTPEQTGAQPDDPQRRVQSPRPARTPSIPESGDRPGD